MNYDVLGAVASNYHVSSWTWEMVLRLLVASGLGGLVGLERELHGRSAGLRTHLLVCLGAALAMTVSLNFAEVFSTVQHPSLQVDPARVAYGVMAGIGFLGAGAIMHYGFGIRGLTTAAGLWCAASIGLASGFGMFTVAAVATLIVLFALRVLDYIEDRIAARANKRLTIVLPTLELARLDRCREILQLAGVRVDDVHFIRDFKTNEMTVTFYLVVRIPRLRQAIEAMEKGQPDLLKMTLE